MYIYRYLLILAVFGFVSAFPFLAYSKEIPFHYTYTNDVNGKSVKGLGEQLLVCSGPFGRRSKVKEVSPALDHKDIKFYSAEVTIFSPYGKWRCCTYTTDGRAVADLGCPSTTGEFLLNLTDFHLYKDDKKVDVTLYLAGLHIEKDSDEIPENNDRQVSTHATLGDDNNTPKRDRDTWTIQSPGPDDLLITLEEDPESGHIGEEATLILRSGSTKIESQTGVLPIELAATLPGAGEYDIVVEHHNIPNELKYRGNYILTIESASGDIQVIIPSTDAEQ